MTIEAFTDGACRGNPGPGGWGVLLRQAGREQSLKGGEAQTTNNRMELSAAIEALKAVEKGAKITVSTDSKYVQLGITTWISSWKKRGWRTSSNQLVKNLDLWQTLDALTHDVEVSWQWVKGHSGHRENDIADQLANEAIDELLG